MARSSVSIRDGSQGRDAGRIGSDYFRSTSRGRRELDAERLLYFFAEEGNFPCAHLVWDVLASFQIFGTSFELRFDVLTVQAG